MTPSEDNAPVLNEHLRCWRLILGGGDADGICGGDGAGKDGLSLSGADLAMDKALSALYDSERRGWGHLLPR